MPTYRVRYTGPLEVKVEAFSIPDAENCAEDTYGNQWDAEEIEEEEK